VDERRLRAHPCADADPLADADGGVVYVKQTAEEADYANGGHIRLLRSPAPPSLTRAVPRLPIDLQGGDLVVLSPSSPD
jgi:hypothetical protein